jgi:hypothetical protein
VGVSANAQTQSETQNSETTETPEINSEVITEDDQRTRKPPRQATHNIGLKNGTDVICKKSKTKGTRLRVHKTCKTRAQWDVERLAAKQGLGEYKAQTSIGQSR